MPDFEDTKGLKHEELAAGEAKMDAQLEEYKKMTNSQITSSEASPLPQTSSAPTKKGEAAKVHSGMKSNNTKSIDLLTGKSINPKNDYASSIFKWRGARRVDGQAFKASGAMLTPSPQAKALKSHGLAPTIKKLEEKKQRFKIDKDAGGNELASSTDLSAGSETKHLPNEMLKRV